MLANIPAGLELLLAGAAIRPTHRPRSPLLPSLPTLQVKNIEKIELGRYEMETWYYSPFPPEYRDCKVGAA